MFYQGDYDGRGQQTASPMLTAIMSGGVGISGRCDGFVSQQWLSGECSVSRETNDEYIVSREMMDCITAWLNSEYTRRRVAE